MCLLANCWEEGAETRFSARPPKPEFRYEEGNLVELGSALPSNKFLFEDAKVFTKQIFLSHDLSLRTLRRFSVVSTIPGKWWKGLEADDAPLKDIGKDKGRLNATLKGRQGMLGCTWHAWKA